MHGDLSSALSPNSSEARWLKAKKLLSLQSADSIRIGEVASECCMSRSHFSRAFKEATGMAPQAWLLNCKLERSVDLLKCLRNTIAEVALESGFCDQSHFIRTFSRAYGVTPNRWRKDHAAWSARSNKAA
jgi:AraC-like DNA-binding protein